MDECISGFIIDVKDYRDYDALITIICEEYGLMTLIARGIRKSNSKNAYACQLFTYVRFQIHMQQQKKIQILKTAEILHSYRKIREDLMKQTIASYFCECIYKSRFEECGICSLLKQAMDILEMTTHPMRILCLFQSIMNHMHGIEPYVDGCVRCGSNHGIFAISLSDGGLVCKKCFYPMNDEVRSIEDLKCFRLLCKAKIEHYDILKTYSDFTYRHFCDLYAFFEEYAGIHLKSVSFLNNLMKM